MKRIRRILIIGWLTWMIPSGQGQILTSSILNFSDQLSSKEIVRVCDDSLAVTYVNPGEDDSRHHRFSVRNLNTDVITEFSLSPLTSVPCVVLEVNDMVVVDRRCYFCGSGCHYSGAPERNEDGYMELVTTSPEGIVGWFSVDDLLAGAGTCTMYELEGSGVLTRMSAYMQAEADVVLAVGRESVGPRSCLAKLTVPLSDEPGDQFVLVDLDEDEVLDDISAEEGLTKLVSHFIGGEHQENKFAVSVCKNGMELNLFYGRTVFDMYQDDLWREQSSPILIKTIGSNEIMVGYAINPTRWTGGWALIRLDLGTLMPGSLSIEEVQRGWIGMDRYRLRDIAYHGLFNTAAMVFQSDTSSLALLSQLYRNDDLDDVLMLHDDTIILNALDVFGRKYLFGGHGNHSVPLHVIQFHGGMTLDVERCVEVTPKPFTLKDSVPPSIESRSWDRVKDLLIFPISYTNQNVRKKQPCRKTEFVHGLNENENLITY